MFKKSLAERLQRFVAANDVSHVVQQQQQRSIAVSIASSSKATRTVTAPVGARLSTLLTSRELTKCAIARINDNKESQDCDLHQVIGHSVSSVNFFTPNDSALARVAVAHTTAHLLGHALESTFDGALLHDGPAKEDGAFHYDCSLPSGRTITADALPELESIIAAMIRAGHQVERKTLSLEVAREIFNANPYKLQLIARIGERSPTVDAYRIGDFVDLCAGPHVPSMLSLGADAFRLHSVSGTHVQHEQRVNGVAFSDTDQLKQWQKAREEAASRDHRRIGSEQELFMFSEYSPGGVMMLPAGQRVRQAIQRELRREYRRRGYEEVSTPQIFDRRLWERSGHWENYRNDMFEVTAPSHGAEATAVADDSRQFLKPMNCPSHCVMYGRKVHSHRELPVRYADFGALHRNELAGALRGLTRLRRFCQDDAHIFCTPQQIASEVLSTLDFVVTFYAKLGFDTSADSLKFALSTRPESSIGDDELWATAEGALKEALEGCEHTRGRWSVAAGDGAFYGPKIDVTLRDAAGRWHQCGTVQLDYNLPQRFNLLYQDANQVERHVVMIHRAVCGSLERMFAVLTEHHAGRWPLWLAPVRAVVIPIAATHRKYAAQVAAQLRDVDPDAGYEVQVDDSENSLSKRIRTASTARVPYVLVVGDKEVSGNLLNVRRRGSSDGATLTVAELLAECKAKADAFE